MSARAFDRKLVLVHGKGGVGKTAISRSLAMRSAAAGARTLWVGFDDPNRRAGEIRQTGPLLFELNCELLSSFEEYAGILIGLPGVTKLFVRNRLIRYLVEAAPGMKEIVLLGKVWHERTRFDHVVVDMPSTGHALAMVKSTLNYAKLFRGGPVHRDSKKMYNTFNDPSEAGHVIVSLPEEMPLRESIEFADKLTETLPDNPPEYVLNRKFPQSIESASYGSDPLEWESPLAATAEEYQAKRPILEKKNLEIWGEADLSYLEFPYLIPTSDEQQLATDLSAYWPEASR